VFLTYKNQKKKWNIINLIPQRFSHIEKKKKKKPISLTLFSETGSTEGVSSSLICGKTSNDLFNTGFLEK
jgi:hypothetical protein